MSVMHESQYPIQKNTLSVCVQPRLKSHFPSLVFILLFLILCVEGQTNGELAI